MRETSQEKGTKSVRCCWCGFDGIEAGTPVCPNCKKGIADVLPPDSVLRGGRYRIEKVLGKGGFGITYRAWDTEFERTVAIKEYFPTSYAHRDHNSNALTVTTDDIHGIEKGLDGFRREGRHLARVEHPNIPTVYDRFDENNTSYMVMEFLDGRSLKYVMQGKPLPVDQVVQIMDALVSALSATHAQGIHHLDIKPDNVIVQANGRVVLIDFGAARQGNNFGDTSIAALTPGYAPLELQARQAYGPETDIFELGMMLHQMLTGKLPPSANERLLTQQNWAPEGVDEPWKTLIIEATRLRADERPTDVRAWWYRSEAVANSSTIPSSVQTVERPGLLAPTINRGQSSTPGKNDATVVQGTNKSRVFTQQEDTRIQPKPQPKPNSTMMGVGIGVVALAGFIAFLAFSKPGTTQGSDATPTPSPSATTKATTTPEASQGPSQLERQEATNELKVVLGKINSAASDEEIVALLPSVKKAIEKGADVDASSSRGVTSLHYAAALGEADLAEFICNKRADVNIRDEGGKTPLHYAAGAGSVAIVQMLLKRNANANAKDAEGKTPLEKAQQYGKSNVVALLKKQQ
jgi:serine/threonine protein kinase